MSDGDRPVPASERRLLRVRERGMMPVRRAPVALAGLCGGAVGVVASGAVEHLAGAMRAVLHSGLAPTPVDDAGAVMASIIGGVAAAAWPVCAGGVLGAVLGALAQTGGVLAWNRPRGTMGARLRAMSGPGALGRACAGLAWAVCALGTAGVAVWVQWADIARLPREPMSHAVPSGVRIAAATVLTVGVVLAVLAVVDALLARAAWQRSLAMTPQDARDEQRATDGDPAARARRQRTARRRLRASHDEPGVRRGAPSGAHA